MTKAQELKDQTINELRAHCEDLRKELYKLMTENRQTQKMEQAHRIPSTRREIARTLTIIRQKELAEQQA